jgi:hypothetical protein
MGQIRQTVSSAIGWGALALATLCILGCESTPNGGGNGGDDYNLVVVLEKNLDTDQDIIYVQFRRNDLAIPGAFVVIDGDTIKTSATSGRGNKTYNTPRWGHGEKVFLAAVDTSESFVYRDSVVIPDELFIDQVLPANQIWRPVDGNAQVSWTTSPGAVNYMVSVRARDLYTSSTDLAEYSESQTALTHIIPPKTFRDVADNVVEDVYDIKIVAYAPNFIARPNAPYETPLSDDVQTPILRDDIDGAVAALVVSAKDTLLVQTQ